MGEESADFESGQLQQPMRMRLRSLGGMQSQPQSSALQEQGLGQVEGSDSGSVSGSRGDSGIEQCAYRSSRVCRMTDWLQQSPDWARMQAAPGRLFAASNEPHEISCVNAGAAAGDQQQQQQQQQLQPQSQPQQAQQQSPQGGQAGPSLSAGGTFDKCYAPDVYTCVQGQLLLKVCNTERD